MAEPRRILVIMLRRIGDVILTTPAVRALKKLFPGAAIDFLVEPPGQEALDGDPNLRRILVYGPGYLGWIRKVRAERYDWVIDYMGNPRSAALTFASGAEVKAGPAHVSHRWAYNRRLVESSHACYAGLEKIRVLRSLGLAPDETDYLPTFPVPPAALARAANLTAALWPGHNGPLVGLVPASRKATRRWPAASYAELGRLLARRRGARLLVFWGPGEEALAAEVARAIGSPARVSPATADLKALAALISRCALVATNCNGPKHIAVARGVPTVTIHGSSDPVCWNPPDPAAHPVARLNDLHCIGCRRNDCPYHLECMRDLEPAAVSAIAETLLDRAHPAGAGTWSNS